MAVQTESPTLGRGTDWNSFYGTEPLEANDPFSPSAFGQLLFAEPDAASARGLLGIADALLDLTFADIGGTIGLDQLPPGSVASLDTIDQDALYFFNNSTGSPELISNAETVAFISPALNFSDIQGNLSIEQFPPGSVVTIDSIDEDALYFFDNTLFAPRLINSADTLTFLGITGGGSFLSANTARVDPSGNDSTGTIGDLGKPFLTVQAAIDALEAIDAADAVIDIGNNKFQTEDLTLDANHVTSLSFKGVNLEAQSVTFNSLTVNNDSGKTVYLNFFDTNFGFFGGITTGADLLYVLMPGGYGRSVTNTVGSIVLSAETQTGEIAGNITAVGDITCQGLSQIQGTISSTGAGTIRIKNCRPFFADDTNGAYLGLPTIDSAGSEVWVTGSPVQSVTAAGTLHLIDSRVVGTNNATSTVYADVLLLPRYQMSIDFDATAGLKLLNDSATPGNSKYYGTDSGGTKGYFALVGGGDASTNTSSSVDSEIALFSGTAGKTLKRASGSGLAVLTSGVLSTTSNNSSNWDTAFTERAQWNGGATNLVAATGRTNLGLVIGTNVQAWDTDLDSWASITRASGFDTFVATPTSANLASLLTDESGTGGGFVRSSGAALTALTGLAIRSTGAAFDLTFASSEVLTAGRTLSINMGNAARTLTFAGNATISGTNSGDQDLSGYQLLDSDLTTIAGLTATTDNFIVSVSSAWASRTPSQVRTTLGLVIGTNVQAWDADLDTWATITPASGVGTFLATPSSANLASAVTDETGSGSLVFGTSPIITTPTISTVASAAGTALNLNGTISAAGASSIAGTAANLTASAAIAGTTNAGASAGGGIALTAGNAARLTSGNANGGSILLQAGSGIGTGISGVYQFGGTTSSFPGFLQNGSKLIFSLADGTVNNGVFCVGGASASLRLGTDTTGGSQPFLISTSVISGASTYVYGWASGTTGATNDTGLARNAAGVVEVNNGTAATYRDLKLRNIVATGTATTYNGIVTAGTGLPYIVGVGRVTAQTAANSNIVTYTTPASDGSYEISMNMNVTAVTALSTSMNCDYTDESNTARTMIFPTTSLSGAFLAGGLVTAVGAFETPVMHIRTKASTTIKLYTAAGTFTSVTYTAEGIIKQMA